MSYWTYILYSESTVRYYCGSTNDIARRLKQHNDPDYKGSKTTKRFVGPWSLVWEKRFRTRSEAMKMERKIKSRGIGRFLKTTQSVEFRQRRN